MELHPLFKIFFTGINNMHDPSGILQPRAVWSMSQNLEMKIGANIFYGDNGDRWLYHPGNQHPQPQCE
jgi:hypothetical protein